MANKHVTFRGPLFDGRAQKAIDDFVIEFAENYADDVNRQLQQQFTRVFKNPTGHYASRIRPRRVGRGKSQVAGNVTPYAAWLEGTGRRNRRSRFKGYKSFQIVAPKAERKARMVANAEFRMRYLRRMK